MNKTNAMRILDKDKIPYEVFDYSKSKALDAKSVASFLGEEEDHVFKTLVTVGKSREHYVFVVPANKELDLKKAANESGEKNIEMLPQKELLPLTGYVHGGCSPIGMKKAFATFLDISAKGKDHIFVSGGKIGLQIRIDPENLAKLVSATFADISKEEE